ncbi:MAG: hypothetical protein K6C12_09475 [Oscillospiraceae bacterium]|nr:hypothetical protein [Oscillospiraceae bacterium]
MTEKDLRKNRSGSRLLIALLCILAVMAAAVLVRTPSARVQEESKERVDAYTDRKGLPYFKDMDSYYHVRLVRNYLNGGSLGDSVSEDGEPWDSLRFWPDGLSADYTPGIVYLTVWASSLTGAEPEKTEFCLAACSSAFAALIAFLIGCRLGGIPGGLTAGLLAGCGPVYAVRTAFGRFDTDLFVVPMELLLILFLTECFRAGKRWRRIVCAACFALTAMLFGRCWQANYAVLFAGLTLAGALLFVLIPNAGREKAGNLRRQAGRFAMGTEWKALLVCGGLTVLALLVSEGPSLFRGLLSALSLSTSSGVGEGVLPNLFSSVSELNRAYLFPDHPLQFFLGYVKGSATAAVNGVGGGAAFLLSLAGLVLLFLRGYTERGAESVRPDRRACALYCCVLGAWLAAGLYLTRIGVRFVEHLSIPVSLLAGAFVGQSFLRGNWKQKADLSQKRERRAFLRDRFLPVLFLAAAVIPALTGAVGACRDLRPSASDASASAMRWIRDNAEAEDAVVASWWDLGYFYESESGHPTLWDGGSQNAERAILVSKALTTDRLELSRRILLMLSGSGNRAIAFLRERTDTRTAYEALWKALTAEREAAVELLQERCNLSREEAEEAESLIHPANPKETYLIITYTMTRQIGWYEYFSGWDFTGKQSLPSATLYTYTPDGTPIFDTEAGQQYLDQLRGRETMWRLFFNAERSSRFTPVYEAHDGLEHVRVWRVEA